MYLDWQAELIGYPVRALEFSTILHVALLVFLRLNTVRNSLSYGDSIIKLRRYMIIAIWILSIVFTFLPILASIFKMKELFYYSNLVNLNCFGTVPIAGIILMYELLIQYVKKKQRKNQTVFPGIETLKTQENNRRMTLVISRGVIVLLICYLPYLVERHYYYGTIVKKAFRKITMKVILY